MKSPIETVNSVDDLSPDLQKDFIDYAITNNNPCILCGVILENLDYVGAFTTIEKNQRHRFIYGLCKTCCDKYSPEEIKLTISRICKHMLNDTLQNG